MNSNKILHFVFFLFFSIICHILPAQNGWTTCGSTAGLLNGTTTTIHKIDTTSASVFTTNPSPAGTIPQTEFLIILQDSLAADSLGWAIVGTSIDGRVCPNSLNMVDGDTLL